MIVWAHGIVDGVRQARRLGVNPGGEVNAVSLNMLNERQLAILSEHAGTLLNRQQVKQLDELLALAA